MRNIALLIISVLLLSCDSNNLEPEVDRMMPSVAFRESFYEVSENDDTLQIEVFSPVTIGHDIEISYRVLGEAENNIDYLIEGMNDDLQGTMQIIHKDTISNLNSNDLALLPLNDGITDGDKSIKIVLLEAKYLDEAGNEFLLGLGQGGMANDTATVLIKDFDCDSDLSGKYDYEFYSSTLDPEVKKGELELTKAIDGEINEYDISDIASGLFGENFTYRVAYKCGKFLADGDLLVNGELMNASDQISLFVTFNCCGISGRSFELILTPIEDEKK
ncbi:hypothetical protein [Aureibacter tunicatorum]|uniref:Uncharacterized protein n=1 Tax=Aureibacter tunicatorum TaxID=866807 RepID=A0AAE3XKP2_9BACT|nr:hypothetical protein [Aureibacter tunicatorum]MDR6238192.1 hypothetical protein [Aureibacter tunicatorum]BDD03225.1 hypothetical protein AUTU_07080 [Aureibacter tunicatorum]